MSKVKFCVIFINNRCYVDVINGKSRLRRGTGIYEPSIERQRLIKRNLLSLLLNSRANEDNVFEIINKHVNDYLCKS